MIITDAPNLVRRLVRSFLDSFTGTNLTLITSRAPDQNPYPAGWVKSKGGTFSVEQDDIVIHGNKASTKAVTNGQITFSGAVVDTGTANILITSKIKTSSTSSITNGILLRRQDDSNFWRVGPYSETNTANSTLRILEVSGGVQTIRKDVLVPFAVNTQYDISAQASGNDLTVSYGAYSNTYTSTFLNTATQHGIMCQSSSSSDYASGTQHDDVTMVAI